MGTKKVKMIYRGPDKDISYNPWLWLMHGKQYDLEIVVMKSGKYRVNVTDGYERARISYNDKKAFEKEWCR